MIPTDIASIEVLNKFAEMLKKFPNWNIYYLWIMSGGLIAPPTNGGLQVTLSDDDLEELKSKWQDMAGWEVGNNSSEFVLEALPLTVVYTLQDGDIDPDNLIEGTLWCGDCSADVIPDRMGNCPDCGAWLEKELMDETDYLEEDDNDE